MFVYCLFYCCELFLYICPDPARKLYDIYHCCVYSEKLLMMDRGTVRNKFEKLVHLFGFIIRILCRCRLHLGFP